jgi:hypothetical protein
MDTAQNDGPDAGNDQPEKTLTRDAPNSIAISARFTGTSNPRALRALAALLARPIPRKQLDDIAGCSNAPELVSSLREKGLEIPCVRIHFIDRDGRPCKPGVYSLTATDRRRLHRWMASRKATNG